jgi:hypothetical protein
MKLVNLVIGVHIVSNINFGQIKLSIASVKTVVVVLHPYSFDTCSGIWARLC